MFEGRQDEEGRKNDEDDDDDEGGSKTCCCRDLKEVPWNLGVVVKNNDEGNKICSRCVLKGFVVN